MGNTNISYATKVANVGVGCPGPCVSPGCSRCWARQLHDLRHRALLAGKHLPEMYRRPFSRLQLFPERFAEVLSWRQPQRVFWGSQTDLGHAQMPADFVAACVGVMAATPEHTHLVLTKRPERMAELLLGKLPDPCKSACAHLDAAGIERGCGSAFDPSEWPLPNAVVGASICTQPEADRILPILGKLAAAGWRTWASFEPLIESVDVEYPETLWPDGPERCCNGDECGCRGLPTDPPLIIDNPGFARSIEWGVIGCESGSGRRTMPLEWAERLTRQLQRAKIRVFDKQLDVAGKVITGPTSPLWPGWATRELPEAQPPNPCLGCDVGSAMLSKKFGGMCGDTNCRPDCPNAKPVLEAPHG